MLLDYKLDRRIAVVCVTAIHKEKDEVTRVIDHMEPLTNDTTEKEKAQVHAGNARAVNQPTCDEKPQTSRRVCYTK
jgi:hypothetical protein